MDLERELIRCMRCGACRAVCPVFAETPVESAVARGKMSLVEAVIQQDLKPSAYLYKLLTRCTGCTACVENCPSGVAVYDILLEARSNLCRGSWWDRIRKLMVRESFKRPGLMPGSIRMSTMMSRVSPRLRRMMSLPTPKRFPSPSRFWAREPVLGGERKAAYFPGCLTDHFYPGVIESMSRIALAGRFTLVFPKKEKCCGAPFSEMGGAEMARNLANECLAEFENQGVEAVLVTCATCAHHLKRYYRGPLEIQDATAWITANGLIPKDLSSMDVSVTYHDPCHLNRGLGIHEEPREIIRSVPGVSLVEMKDPARCCGSGGEFNVVHGDLSAAIRVRKLDDILGTGAGIVSTCCPGCTMHIAEGLKERGMNLPVLHPIQILAMAVEGGDPEILEKQV